MIRSSSGATRTFGDRKHSADTTQTAVERKLAARRVLGKAGAWKLMRRREQRQGDRQIEPRALLLQLCGRKVDRDATPRKVQLRGKNSTAYALLRLLAGAVSEPDDGQRRCATLDVRLHLDVPRLEADEGKGDRAREHTSTLWQAVSNACAGSAPNP